MLHVAVSSEIENTTGNWHGIAFHIKLSCLDYQTMIVDIIDAYALFLPASGNRN